jgi:hypothetical protein
MSTFIYEISPNHIPKFDTIKRQKHLSSMLLAFVQQLKTGAVFQLFKDFPIPFRVIIPRTVKL